LYGIETAKLADQLFGQTVGEILPLGVSGEIL
jgi:hypothetical protein